MKFIRRDATGVSLGIAHLIRESDGWAEIRWADGTRDWIESRNIVERG